MQPRVKSTVTPLFNLVDQGSLIAEFRNDVTKVTLLKNIVAAHDVRVVHHLESCLLVFQ